MIIDMAFVAHQTESATGKSIFEVKLLKNGIRRTTWIATARETLYESRRVDLIIFLGAKRRIAD
jgi:hypothetical protein